MPPAANLRSRRAAGAAVRAAGLPVDLHSGPAPSPTALVSSACRGCVFCFEGFPTRQAACARQALQELARRNARTLVAVRSAHRLVELAGGPARSARQSPLWWPGNSPNANEQLQVWSIPRWRRPWSDFRPGVPPLRTNAPWCSAAPLPPKSPVERARAAGRNYWRGRWQRASVQRAPPKLSPRNRPLPPQDLRPALHQPPHSSRH